MSTASADSYETLMQFLYRAPIGLVETTLDGEITMLNPMSVQLLMMLARDSDLVNFFTALDAVAPQIRALTSAFTGASGVVCEGVRIRLDAISGLPAAAGNTSTQVISVSLLKLNGANLMGVLTDVTLEVQREQQGLDRRLSVAVRTDVLTHVPNREALRERLQQVIDRPRTRIGETFAVLFLNCDRFKQLNDSLGPATGDAVLGMIAGRLRSTLRLLARTDRIDACETMVARFGGDEFVVILDDLQHPEEAQAVAQRLLTALFAQYSVGVQQLGLTVSMGVVHEAQSPANADIVLQLASIAMAEAKSAGGARFAVFEPAMQIRAARRGEMEAELRRAIVDRQLFVVYQPVVGLRSGNGAKSAVDHSAGVEALVRWLHPTRGVVMPHEFITLAEECGLIGDLGEYVLDAACEQFVRWQHELGPRAPRLLAVNLSKAQLGRAGFVERVAGILRARSMKPGQLQLEVTETLAAQDESVQEQLRALKQLGLTLALDDFGTGYSSLASLHQLPVDTVKIDRSFVSQSDTSPHHRVLIEATVRVANSLGMTTVAEGIETDAQAAVVRQLGCDKAQGFFYSPPLAATALAQWLVGASSLAANRVPRCKAAAQKTSSALVNDCA